MDTDETTHISSGEPQQLDPPMHWMLGLKLSDEDKGALAFAKHLRTSSQPTKIGAQHTIELAVHTMEPEVVAELNTRVDELADKALRLAELDGVKCTIFPEGRPESNLGAAAHIHGVDALVLGRRSPAGGLRLIRLGAVARRLLRELPVPVVIAPPEVASAGLGKGPVVLAVDMETDFRESATFAKRVATTLDRELVLAHVFPIFTQFVTIYVPVTYGSDTGQVAREAARATLKNKAEKLGLEKLRSLEADGEVVASLVDLAREQDACMVVCSSRQLTTFARIFDPSAGLGLAANAPCPVAVVPCRNKHAKTEGR